MVRRASEKDIKSISNLLEQVLLIHHNMRPDLFKKQGAKYTEAQLREILNDPLKPIFVYVDEDDNVLGHLFAQITETEEGYGAYGHTTLYLDDICIDEKHRHKGIGGALCRHVEEFAKSIGAHNMIAHVWEGNEKSMSLCKKMAMTPQKTVMEKVLTSE